jgi:hypothetical protein
MKVPPAGGVGGSPHPGPLPFACGQREREFGHSPIERLRVFHPNGVSSPSPRLMRRAYLWFGRSGCPQPQRGCVPAWNSRRRSSPGARSRTADFRPLRAHRADVPWISQAHGPGVTPKRLGARGPHRNTSPTPPGAPTIRRNKETLIHPGQDPLPTLPTQTIRDLSVLPMPCPTCDMESGEASGPENVFRSCIWTRLWARAPPVPVEAFLDDPHEDNLRPKRPTDSVSHLRHGIGRGIRRAALRPNRIPGDVSLDGKPPVDWVTILGRNPVGVGRTLASDPRSARGANLGLLDGTLLALGPCPLLT